MAQLQNSYLQIIQQTGVAGSQPGGSSGAIRSGSRAVADSQADTILLQLSNDPAAVAGSLHGTLAPFNSGLPPKVHTVHRSLQGPKRSLMMLNQMP